MTRSVHSNRYRALSLPVMAVAGASVLFAACSSSTKPSSSPTAKVAPAAGATPTTGAPSSSNASVTVSAASVPGVGTVLVDGNGRTLYVLASEKGGKVTCTSAGGCTTIWPAVVLPSGMSRGIVGTGVQASLLGTVTAPGGDVRLTYGGWPLYTFTADTRPGTAKGQNLKDAFGLWWALSPSGQPITASAASSPNTAPPAGSTPTTAVPQSGGAGF